MPVQWHALCLGLFASIIAPFGGFFASGFKRAFKIKVLIRFLLAQKIGAFMSFQSHDELFPFSFLQMFFFFFSGKSNFFERCRILVTVYLDMVDLPTEWIAK